MSAVDGLFTPPLPSNEPVLGYAAGSPERAVLQAELSRMGSEVVEIPCLVGGQEVYTGITVDVTNPCDHRHVLARAHVATPELVGHAIDTAVKAQQDWAALPWQERAAVFLRAADLLSGPWRARINASTMLCQGKTSHQAEIDAACELADFWRFNVAYAAGILADQPGSNPGMWNRLDHRPLEGFVFAVTPFNFTSIALNLPTAPALMGNVAIWKPSTTQLLSAWEGMQLLRAAGLPDGVIAFLPGHGADVGDPVMGDPRLAGLHFTGSTATFRHMWRRIADNLDQYRTYPRIVGETGGKDFIIAHESAGDSDADLDRLAVAIARGGFEYQGQKCSAASRIYMPDSIWPAVRDRVLAIMSQLRMGDVRDFGNFLGPVIDERAFRKHEEYLRLAHDSAHVLAGGEADGTTGWFVQPTLAQVDDPNHRLMQEEIFGPVLSAWVYPAARYEDALEHVDNTSPYALTGAVFARDRYAVQTAMGRLRHAAGNFYVNDKPTGAVVGQQPFGGARASGTNDKAGSPLNLLRWVSPRTIKETLAGPTDWRYPFLDQP
ncbi:MAG: L-glutamate gamma-semialdehyde dehydrogenase [Alphaproteobacteria bacterium]|nr:L-glutamate gamma-semialdehyde dehydrogenase [Alphaproteobacteria bacterium]